MTEATGFVSSHDDVQISNGSANNASLASNPRSCVTCRRRKVKCDKKQPCANCVRAKTDCIFPGPGRAPRRNKKPQDGELMDRLRRLETVVQTLNAQVEEHEQEAAERERKDSLKVCPMGTGGSKGSPSVAIDDSVDGLESRFGRLVVDQGRSRYINNSFWASLNTEVEDLKAILIDPSEDEEDTHDSPGSNLSQHQGFMFGYSSTNVDMFALHPSPETAREYWEVYKENVEPLVKVLHVPTFEPKLLEACGQLGKLSRGIECFMFTIYYGAITSLTSEECLKRWGEDRATLLSRYRFGLEQGLARANFLHCDETIILKALVVFLILLRRNDEARRIWTLTGLAVRIAQTLGIHRDGSHFKLPPFETEMRRRLWWQVCVLDARSSEDQGSDPTITDSQFDTKMPLNINDTDMNPEMTEFPEERVGFTDMTFSLMRFEVVNIFRRMIYIPPAPNPCTEFFSGLTIAQKEKWIGECHERLEEKYLRGADMSVPLNWVTATISRLIMSKMWLVVYHPHQRRDGGASLPQETKDKLFITSLENIEYSVLLETEARTKKWGWLFRTYVQWHAIAFLLSELCVRTRGEAVDRAWRAIEYSATRWWNPLEESNYRMEKHGCLWKPLTKLMERARAARERELALEAASRSLQDGSVNYSAFPQLSAEGAPQNFGPDPDTVDKMLRPSAPRLGEMPVANSPSWTGSPALPDWPAPAFNDNTPSKDSDPPRTQANSSAAMTFQSMSNYGLDTIIGDVMQGMTYEGPILSDTANALGNDHLQTNPNMNLLAGNNEAVQPLEVPLNQPSHLESIPGGMVPNAPDLDFASLDDAAGMDWTEWDELVRVYGMDGIQTGLTPSGPSRDMPVMNWF